MSNGTERFARTALFPALGGNESGATLQHGGSVRLTEPFPRAVGKARAFLEPCEVRLEHADQRVEITGEVEQPFGR